MTDAYRRKRQPTAEMMREQLRLAADEIIRLRTPWWHRIYARLVETDKQTAALAALERV